MIRNPLTNKATAFVGMNNPHLLTAEAKAGVFCTDICEKFDWLSWDQFNIGNGYSFCCEVDDFRKTVDTLPEFGTFGLLGNAGRSVKSSILVIFVTLISLISFISN